MMSSGMMMGRENLFMCSVKPTKASKQLALFPNFHHNGRRISRENMINCPRCEIRPTLASESRISSRDETRAVHEQHNSLPVNTGCTRERPSIMVIGLSFHTAPLEMREKLAVADAELRNAIEELSDLNHIDEAAVLSTCNRMEVYVVALSWHRGTIEVKEWMSKKSGISIHDLQQHLFLLRDDNATQHLFEVAAGLDSLVLGEAAILSQVKNVVRTAEGLPGFGRSLSTLFKYAITAGKRVRTEIKISSGAVSVSSAAVEMAYMKLQEAKFNLARMLVIGAGKMGKLVIKHLVSKGCHRIVVINRSVEKVTAIEEELEDAEIVYQPPSEIFSCAAEADVIFTCTSSDTHLFMKDHVVDLPPVKEGLGNVRLFIDISVPRNVSPYVSEVDTACVYNVDDLKEVVEATKEDRAQKAIEAHSIVTEESKHFRAWKDSLETVPTLKKLRLYAERIREAEVEKFLSRVGDGIPLKTKRAAEDLARAIVNKLLHGPMRHLRCDGSEGGNEQAVQNMHALNRMYDLETEVFLVEQKIKEKVSEMS